MFYLFAVKRILFIQLLNMLTSTTAYAMHLIISSFQGIRAVRQVLGYVLPRNMSSTKAKINFNAKHLSKGDPLPPYNGKLRLYNMRFCPFAQRAVLALNVKNIDYEIVNVDLADKPEWLITKSALTKVPALEVADGVSIFESLIIAEYLDEAYPEVPLLPKDPVKKAFDKIIVEACSAQIHPLLIKLIKAPETVTDEVIATYFKALDFIQNHLQQRGTKFLSGDTPGYADYMTWPWFERLSGLEDERIKIDGGKYKLLVEYFRNMWADPVVKEYAVPKEIYREFHDNFSTGKKPNYDLLLEE